MTWGKEPQGPVGPSEVWKELVRPRPDGAICTVALGDLQALLESARTRPGCGPQSGPCASCHVPHALSRAWVAPGGSWPWLEEAEPCPGEGHGSEPRDRCLAPRSCVRGLGQLTPPL